MRGVVLESARAVINGARQDAYGKPEDNFANIAMLWNWYLSTKQKKLVDAGDVAMMMVLLKVAREANGRKLDNVVDACGYLGLYGDIEYGDVSEGKDADLCGAVGRERVGWDAAEEDDLDAFAKMLEGNIPHKGTQIVGDR